MSTLPAGQAPGDRWLDQARDVAAAWPRPRLSAVAGLWLVGLALDALYALAFAGRFPLASHYQRLDDIASLSGKTVGGAALWLASLLAAFALYALGLRLAGRAGRGALAPVLATGLVAALALATMYPVTAIDE